VRCSEPFGQLACLAGSLALIGPAFPVGPHAIPSSERPAASFHLRWSTAVPAAASDGVPVHRCRGQESWNYTTLTIHETEYHDGSSSRQANTSDLHVEMPSW
jgi:hypothetical protein